MLAVLDPWLLHFDDALPLAPLPYDALADVVAMLWQKRLTIPKERSYWPQLEREFLRRLSARMSGDHRYPKLLDRLADLAVDVPLAAPARARLGGFDRLFAPLGQDWRRRMDSVLVRAALTGETIVVTRLVPNRNARAHHHDGRLALVEKSCWELRAEAAGALHRIACVCNSRNLTVPFTRRYDDRLPAAADAAAFPFCPPENWSAPDRTAWRTHESRPAWADAQGHFWAEPAAQQTTGTSHHWDVYLSGAAREEYGVDYLNIARWRPASATDGQAPPGALHHVKKKMEGKLQKKTGWSC